MGLALGLYLARREGFPTSPMYTAVLWAVVGGMVGARATHVIDKWSYYSDHISQIPMLWEGGLGWYGGLIGGVLAAAIYAKVSHYSLGRMFDIAAPAVLVGLSIGRIGCTINGDAYGTPTSLPWAITYTHSGAFAPLGVAGHPAPVYEIIWNLIVVGILFWLRGKFKREGSVFLSMVALYSFGRFFISWVRDEPSILGPLHQAHVFSIILFVAAVGFLVYQESRGKSDALPVKQQE